MDTTETETVILRSMSFEEKDGKVDLGTTEAKLEASDQRFDKDSEVKTAVQINKPTILLPEVESVVRFSPTPRSGNELDAAATKIQTSYRSYASRRISAAAIKIQKIYRSYRTRRNLADCAVVDEEQWWKASDSGARKRSSESLNIEKHETDESRWAWARTGGANLLKLAGKGLSMGKKADKLALHHWLESIDPRHRYGHNLQFYYDVWSETNSTQPFFYWLDIGDGKDINLSKCPRTALKRQGIRYVRPGSSAEWTFLFSGLCLEILSIACDQASSPVKPQYALFGMTLAFGALLICIWELIYKAKKERVELRRWGMLWWYYYPDSHHRLFGTLPDFYGLIGSTSQCICSMVQYVCFIRHADNPIKVSLWPAIFLICLGTKRLAENRNETRDEHRD